MNVLTSHGKLLVYGLTSATVLFGIGLTVTLSRSADRDDVVEGGALCPEDDILCETLVVSVREIPERFKANTHMPAQGEGASSGSIDLGTFSAGRDLVYVDDPRVWWESDHDKNDTECDHSFHRAIRKPFRRVVELVSSEQGTLEVHDAYRPSGIHSVKSLHQEGRALDLTCDQLGLERLAKLCWAAGFDWVYYEASARGGAHVHASVRRNDGTND